MADSYISKALKTYGAYVGGFSVARPVGSVALDGLTLVAFIFGSEAATAFGASTLAKKIDHYSAGIGGRLGVFVGEDDGATAPEIKWTGSLEGEAVLIATGKGAYDESGVSETASSKEPALPEIAVAEAAETLIAIDIEQSAVSSEAPAGMTQRQNGSEGEVFGIHVATGEQAASGSSGAKHFKYAGAVSALGAMVAMKTKPAAATSKRLSMIL